MVDRLMLRLARIMVLQVIQDKDFGLEIHVKPVE
jgi:hypothetical protein